MNPIIVHTQERSNADSVQTSSWHTSSDRRMTRVGSSVFPRTDEHESQYWLC